MKNVQSSLRGETHNQYRNRVGRVSRHLRLMSQNVDRSKRREEIKRFSKASETIEKKVQREIEEIKKSVTSIRDRQISYDSARGGFLIQPVRDPSQMTAPVTHDIHQAMEEPA